MAGNMSLDHIAHPGPVAAQRFASLPCHAEFRQVELAAGIPFDQAVADAVSRAGANAAWLRIRDADTGKLRFVKPAPAPGDGHAAWYSEATDYAASRLMDIGLHLGRRDGAAFLHVHGFWQAEGGVPQMGHLLSDQTILAAPVKAEAICISGAILATAPDPETWFPLFRPVASGEVKQPANAILATIRPNEDLHERLREIAGEAGLKRARVYGIGSLIGTRFTDAPPVMTYATEVLIQDGIIEGDEVSLTLASVGYEGPYQSGQLAPGNRVCVTFEVLIVSEP